MIYPKEINESEFVGITATSAGIESDFDKERLKKSKENLLSLGYKTMETKNVYSKSLLVSSDSKSRAKEFMELWCNNDIKVIALLRGGELLLEILPYLDDLIIKNNNPKWIFGYSDSSLLNLYITTKFKIATINSSNIFQFSIKPLHESLLNIFKCINNNVIIENSFDLYEKEKIENSLNYNLDSKVIYKNLYKDSQVTIKGRMIGGCLEAITEILGTKYDYVEKFCKSFEEGMIWYLDIYDSNPLDLYRKLWQMKEANWFSNINGMIIGRTRSIKEVMGFTYLDCLHKIFDNMNIPVIIDVDIGHVNPQFSIINGSFGTFIYENGKGYLKQEKI